MLRTAVLLLVYRPLSTRSAHTSLIDTSSNDCLRIVTRCLRPTPTVYHPILAGIQKADLTVRGTLSLACCPGAEPSGIWEKSVPVSYWIPVGTQTYAQTIARNIHGATNGLRRKQTPCLCSNLFAFLNSPGIQPNFSVFVPIASIEPTGGTLRRNAYVKLDRLRTAVGRFRSDIHKRCLASSEACECGAAQQTADHNPSLPKQSSSNWNKWSVKPGWRHDHLAAQLLPRHLFRETHAWGGKMIQIRPQAAALPSCL